MTTTILAVDLGKFNSVLVWFEPDTKHTAFRTVRTESAELRRELTRKPVGQVVFEASVAASIYRCARASPSDRRRPSNSSDPITTASILLKSCAMPPVS